MVSYAANSELGRANRDRLSAEADQVVIEVKRRIAEVAPKALDHLVQTLEDETTTPSLKTRVAMNLLDRAGFSGVQKSQVQSIVTHLTADELEELKRRGRETGVVASSEPIDIENQLAEVAQ